MTQGWCASALPPREGCPLFVLVYDWRFRQFLNRIVARESARPPLATPFSAVRIAVPVLAAPGTNLLRVIRWDSLWHAKGHGQVPRFPLDFRARGARFEQIDLRFRQLNRNLWPCECVALPWGIPFCFRKRTVRSSLTERFHFQPLDDDPTAVSASVSTSRSISTT